MLGAGHLADRIGRKLPSFPALPSSWLRYMSKFRACVCRFRGYQRLDAKSAARELREETGLVVRRLTPLGILEAASGTRSQRCWVFLATDLTHGTPERDLEEQDMQSAWFTRADPNA